MHKHHPLCSFAAAAFALAPACAFLDKVDKVSKIPGLEEAQVVEPLKKGPTSAAYDGRDSVLEVPPLVEFGPVPVGSESQRTVVISNPAGFALTILRITIDGCGFQLAGALVDRPVITAGGQVTLIVSFHPVQKGACAGLLSLEIDSVVGRITRVQLKGRGA